MARLRNSSTALVALPAVLLGCAVCGEVFASDTQPLARQMEELGVDETRVVVPFESRDLRIVEFAERSVAGARDDHARVRRLYDAILELKRSGRILSDLENRPKARLPRTGVELLLRALSQEPPLPAGCYELTSALIAAARSVGVELQGLNSMNLDETGQVGHVVAALSSKQSVMFDLQNEVVNRTSGYVLLSDVELAAHHYNHLAVAHQLRSEFERALTAIDDALALDPMNAAFLNNRSTILLSLGSLWSARAESAHAIALAPEIAVYRYQWGLVELALGRISNASRAFRSALALKPDYELARRELARIDQSLQGSVATEAP